jgi:hypothetical protein
MAYNNYVLKESALLRGYLAVFGSKALQKAEKIAIIFTTASFKRSKDCSDCMPSRVRF